MTESGRGGREKPIYGNDFGGNRRDWGWDGGTTRRQRERRVLGVIIRVKYAADIVIIFFLDRMR